MRALVLLAVLAIAYGCGGAPAVTSSPTTGSPTASATVASTTPAGSASAEALCFLTGADWQAFNYVTGAQPTVTSDAPGTAICQYASGLFLEVYTHEQPSDAAATYAAILENAPFDEPVTLSLPGAEDIVFDADMGDSHAGIAVRAGNLVYTISGLARDSAQAELLTLAGLVLQRASHLI